MPIDEAEISFVQIAIRSNLAAQPCLFVETGRRVRIERGPLAGREGILSESETPPRVVVSLTALRRSITIAVEIENLGAESAYKAMAGDRRD